MPPKPDEPNQNITMSYMNNKGLWGFVGGMIAAAIGAKVVKVPLPGNWPSRAFPRPCSSSRRPWNNWQTSGKKPKTCAMRPPRKQQAGTVAISLSITRQRAPVSFSASGMDRPQRGNARRRAFPLFFSLSMHYQVIHHTPGRLRVRSGRCTFNHDQAYGIECRLLKQKRRILRQGHPCNGGVFILYEGTSPQAIFRTLDRLRPETLRSHEPEERAEARKLARSFSPHSGESFLFPVLQGVSAAPAQNGQSILELRFLFTARNGRPGKRTAQRSRSGRRLHRGFHRHEGLRNGQFHHVPSFPFQTCWKNYTRKKTRAALAASLSINIDRVWRVEEVACAGGSHGANPPGEKIRVDAGNVIPVDGTVLSGEAEVNQAAMTGNRKRLPNGKGPSSLPEPRWKRVPSSSGWTPQETSPALTISSP